MGALSRGRHDLHGLFATITLAALTLGVPAQARAQVNDLSGSRGDIGSRIEAAMQQAGRLDEGSVFYVVFRFEGLISSDAEPMGGGQVIIRRSDGWSMSGTVGLVASSNPWDQIGSDERFLDLGNMSLVGPDPAPTLERRPMLAFFSGRVSGEGDAKFVDVSTRLPSGKVRLRDRQVYWLGEAPGPELTTWIGALLSSLDPERDGSVREDLVSLLSLQPQGGDAVSLLERLATGDPDEDVRHRAITYLGRRPEDTSRQLRNILSRAEGADDRAEALTALANRIGPASKPQLDEAARNGQEAEEVRGTAVTYLSRIEGRDVDTTLERLLSDPDTDFRRRVVQAWARRDAGTAVPVLERVAMNDEETTIREEAVSRLGGFEAPQAAAALKRVFDSSEEEGVRKRALTVRLRTMSSSEKVTWLDQVARSDSSFEIRKEAVRQLGRIHTPEALRVLQRLLNVGRL